MPGSKRDAVPLQPADLARVPLMLVTSAGAMAGMVSLEPDNWHWAVAGPVPVKGLTVASPDKWASFGERHGNEWTILYQKVYGKSWLPCQTYGKFWWVTAAPAVFRLSCPM